MAIAPRDVGAPGDAGAPDEVQAWTRAELLRMAALGGAGLTLLGRGAVRALGIEEALAAPVAPGAVHSFVSRPDLKPPTVTVLRPASSTGRGLLFLAPSSGPGQRGVMILDDAGEVIWFHPTTPLTAMDFRVGLYKGQPALSWWEGRHVKGVGKVGEYVILDASYREIARFSAGNGRRPDFHEFLLTPDGTALVTVYDPVSADLSSVGASRRGRVYDGVVQELEIPSARVRFEWHSFDHVGIDESYQTDIGDPFDYFHPNSIAFDSDGDLLVSARNTWAVYKVDRDTGRVMWRLGGKKSDFAMGKGTVFAFQHDARSHDRGSLITLFDNGPDPNTKPRSRALAIALDKKQMRATLRREIIHSPPLYARVTGNTQVLPGGNTLVCWGSTGYFTEYGADGKVRLDARLPEGGQNYRVFRFPWAGRPQEAPKLVRPAAGAGSRPVYASWNGATDVASWQLRVGSKATNLAPARTVPRGGFETRLELPPGAAFAAAAALDRAGKPLSVSNTVRL